MALSVPAVAAIPRAAPGRSFPMIRAGRAFAQNLFQTPASSSASRKPMIHALLPTGPARWAASPASQQRPLPNRLASRRSNCTSLTNSVLQFRLNHGARVRTAFDAFPGPPSAPGSLIRIARRSFSGNHRPGSGADLKTPPAPPVGQRPEHFRRGSARKCDPSWPDPSVSNS